MESEIQKNNPKDFHKNDKDFEHQKDGLFLMFHGENEERKMQNEEENLKKKFERKKEFCFTDQPKKRMKFSNQLF